ncbi:MAG TPA: outer membrane protein assembly factor BamC [Candidatus Competibacteraceae bacterium]|nr:outer membrane protein assembly factor BamC [Candidatus Competibacteraceae bacterium]HRZ06804.1 outer membrane protein assembly factor BamC [Candidatus Competibacteraceae bacterium]HSA45905.1 outer membrane protein assembly factor BamC [Candidatus Competibacteraceae bacterium]
MTTPISHFPWRTTALSTAVAIALSGCSKSFDTLLPDRRPDYRQSTISQPLEIPPDLTASTIDDTLMVPEINPSGSASLSAYAKERGGPQPQAKQAEAVLPPQPGITVQQDGNQRWLVINAPADQVWPKVREFWTSTGFALKRDDPTIGIMETDWVENRADIPEDGVRSLLKKYLDVLYSAPTRDKFRTRLERSADGRNTEVYMTHYGVEEVAMGGSGASTSSTYTWQRRPPSPELEAEMLNRLTVYLGASEKRAEVQQAKGGTATASGPRVRLVEESGENRLFISEDYSRSWRLVGLALDGSNYAVEEQNRSQGLYVVEYRDPELEGQKSGDEGWLAKMAFWRSKPEAPPQGTRYRVRLSGQGTQTLVVVRDSNDQPDRSAGAQQVLDVLQKTIK